MKSLKPTLLWLAASMPLHSHAEEETIRDITLTLCPDDYKSDYCQSFDKAVAYPGKEDAPPGYLDSFGSFLMVYEAAYQLSWVAPDDAPVEVVLRCASYEYTPDTKAGQHSYSFSLKDLAPKMVNADNDTMSERVLLGCSSTFGLYIHMFHPDSDYGYGPFPQVHIMSLQNYFAFRDGVTKQYSLGKKDTNKKWRLGVGIGVGLGVPILMALSFVFGRRQAGKSKQSATKHIAE